MTSTLVFSFGHEGNSSIDFISLELALSLIQNKMTHAMKWFKAIFWQVQSQSAQNLFYIMNHCSHFEPRLIFFVFTTILSSSWLKIIAMSYIIEYFGAIILVYCVVEKEKKEKEFVGEQKVKMFMSVYKESIVLKVKSKSCLLCKEKKRGKRWKKEEKKVKRVVAQAWNLGATLFYEFISMYVAPSYIFYIRFNSKFSPPLSLTPLQPNARPFWFIMHVVKVVKKVDEVQAYGRVSRWLNMSVYIYIS